MTELSICWNYLNEEEWVTVWLDYLISAMKCYCLTDRERLIQLKCISYCFSPDCSEICSFYLVHLEFNTTLQNVLSAVIASTTVLHCVSVAVLKYFSCTVLYSLM